MDRGGKPQLSDWMGLTRGLMSIGRDQRQARVDAARQKYYRAGAQRQRQQQAFEHQDRKQELRQQEQEQAREAQKVELENQYVNYLSRGGRPAGLSEITPEDADPQAARKARIDAVAYMQDQSAYSEENARAKAAQWEQDRRELAGLAQKAEAALESGDQEQFNELMTTAYNNYIYDGQRIKETKTDKKGNRIVKTETVDGQEREFKDDLSDKQKLQMLFRMSQDAESYTKQRLAADKGRREFNAEQWKNPEPVKGKDGQTYWKVKQVDPGTHRPSILYFDEEPDADSEAIAIEGSNRFLDQQALELEEQFAAADAEGSAGPDINPLTKNQAIKKLSGYFYESGPLGEMRSKVNNADQRYKVAEEKFNKLVNQMGADEVAPDQKAASLHEAAIRARNYVEKVEEDFFQALEEHPDQQEEVKKQFQSQFGYVPGKDQRPAGM